MARMFPRAGIARTGYNRDQVDEFFNAARQDYEEEGELDAAAVRSVAFDLVAGGYDPAAVDAALDRVEAAFAVRERLLFIKEHGQDEWMREIARRATELYPRLTRPEGMRFRPPAGRRGYEREAVDAIITRIVDFFDSGAPLTSGELRSVTFPAAPASRGYDEGSVDAFIDRTIDILLGVE